MTGDVEVDKVLVANARHVEVDKVLVANVGDVKVHKVLVAGSGAATATATTVGVTAS